MACTGALAAGRHRHHAWSAASRPVMLLVMRLSRSTIQENKGCGYHPRDTKLYLLGLRIPEIENDHAEVHRVR
jgi:hypothetical protein